MVYLICDDQTKRVLSAIGKNRLKTQGLALSVLVCLVLLPEIPKKLRAIWIFLKFEFDKKKRLLIIIWI